MSALKRWGRVLRTRAAVCRRAGGSCEACGRWVGVAGESGHLDHFFGRAKVPESVSNCWLLCVPCDNARTNSKPSAGHWLERFIAHCKLHDLTAEAELARTKFNTLGAKGRAA